MLSRLSRVGCLVLDDLGKESPTDWTLGQVFRVVNDRYENMRPVVVTTQYGKATSYAAWPRTAARRRRWPS